MEKICKMKIKTTLYMLVIICLVQACGNNAEQNKHASEPAQAGPVSLIDSLNQKVNEGHDFSMSKMGKMVTLQKSITANIDSLQQLEPVPKSKISSLKEAGHHLDVINGSMYQWMENFDFDLKNMDSTAKVQYLRTNLKRIQEIDDSTRKFIEEAQKALQP